MRHHYLTPVTKNALLSGGCYSGESECLIGAIGTPHHSPGIPKMTAEPSLPREYSCLLSPD
jgi:hypothetical protein